ncbi:two component system sensor kinase, partial [Candidatus Symbiopectobacterium sp. NZEC135]|nr:two component system sensor kinase [Candidatus Symbiopectobacterium sp. NZEC135]
RRTELTELLGSPVNHNMHWGEPKYTEGVGWSVSVAATSAQGTLAGLSVKLSDVLSYGQLFSGSDISLWLDKQNHILPFSQLDEKHGHALQTRFNDVTLHDGWQEIRTQLKGPGWQQVILYPTRDIINRALSIVISQLPFALATLVLLALMLLGLLHRHLARPLQDFVDIINKTKRAPLSLRLPENRQDELGSIA